MWSGSRGNELNSPVRALDSRIISSGNFFDRKSLSCKNEKLDAIGEGWIVAGVVGDVTVANGRTLIADVESIGTITDGFFTNDKNKC